MKEDISIDLTFLQGETMKRISEEGLTINAIAFSIQDASFPLGGKKPGDIEKKLIRTVSDRSINRTL